MDLLSTTRYKANYSALATTTNSTVSLNNSVDSPQSSMLGPFIVRWSVSLTLVLCGVVGNGVTLVAASSTPSMATKSNKILGQLAITGLLFLTVNISTVFIYNLVVYVVVGQPCEYVVLDTVFQGIQRMPPRISYNHLIVMGIDRYIAVIHPLFYNDRFTDSVLNCMLMVSWTAGILMALFHSMWAVDAREIPCTLYPDVIPSVFTLVFDAGHYLVTAAFLVVVYARILPIALTHRRQIAVEVIEPPPASGRASPALNNETLEAQKRTQRKQRNRQFKAVVLTAAVASFFIVMWFTYALSCLLVVLGVSSSSGSLNDVGSGLGLTNFTFTWVLFGAVSNAYRKAYKNLYRKLCGHASLAQHTSQ